MKRPTLVLMAGLPGVGKSTLADRLGKTLQWMVIDKDTIKDILLENWMYQERTCDNDEVASFAYEISFKLIQEFLIHQRLSIILDSSMLHQSIFEKTVQLAQEADAQLKIILCFSDEEVRQKRMISRTTRPSQIYCQRVREEDFFNIEQHVGTVNTEVLRVCTNNELDTYINRARSYITGKKVATYTRIFANFKYYTKQFLYYLGYQFFHYNCILNSPAPYFPVLIQY